MNRRLSQKDQIWRTGPGARLMEDVGCTETFSWFLWAFIIRTKTANDCAILFVFLYNAFGLKMIRDGSLVK